METLPRSVPEALTMAADVLDALPTGATTERERVLIEDYKDRVRFRIARLIPGDIIDLREGVC